MRRSETYNCLPSCSKYDFKYLGPKEFRKELSRNVEGLNNNLILPYAIGAQAIALTATTGPVAPILAGYLGYKIGNAHNVVSQVLQAVPNQGARNEDFLGTYKNCTLSEGSPNIKDPSALLPTIRPSSLFKSSFPSFSILTITKRIAVTAFDIFSFILSNTYSITTTLLGPPLNALYNSVPYEAKLCGRAVYSLGETLFNGSTYIAKSCLNSSLFSQKIKSPVKKLPIKIGREFKKTTFPYKELQAGDLEDSMELYNSEEKTPRVHIVTDKEFNQKLVKNATSTANYLMGLFACIGSGSC